MSSLLALTGLSRLFEIRADGDDPADTVTDSPFDLLDPDRDAPLR